MPGRHVRFSRTTTYHAPPTPSPAYSLSTLPSSAGPLTPPSLPAVLPGPTPYTFSGPSPKYLGPAHLHPLLAFSHLPSINYDVGNHPCTISTRHLGLSSRALSEPATRPSLPSMTIVSPHFPWSIYVTPSNGAFVSVADVFSAIYHTLRVQITQSEFYSLPSQKDMRRVSLAYEQRYKRLRGARGYEDEKRGGVRRVDFLVGCTRFGGLSATSRGPNVWRLNVS